MISKFWGKLRDPQYRKSFVGSQINIGIPFQIRALLKARGWKQEDLAKKTGMLQPRISGLLTPGKTRPNIETLRRLAEAFDCGLIVKFVPFSELTRWSEGFDPETFAVASFEQEDRLLSQPVTFQSVVFEPEDITVYGNFSVAQPGSGIQVIGREVSKKKSLAAAQVTSFAALAIDQSFDNDELRMG